MATTPTPQISTLQWALKAGLPLIASHTRDRINAQAVVHHLTGKVPIALTTELMKDLSTNLEEGGIYYCGASSIKNASSTQLYGVFAESGASLIVYNDPSPSDAYFNSGPMPTPPELVMSFLANAIDKEQAIELLPILGGLTIKEVTEAYRLTHERDGKITPRGVGETRKALFAAVQGVQLVDTTLPLYWPSEALEEYAGPENMHFFLHDDKNPRLRPRGLMLKGVPGVGKTAYAKYLANKWGIPLLRLGVEIHGKYVGQSEQNFANAIAQVDAQEPAILLLDEVEKMVGNSREETSGTTQKVLSQMLWWLQEHKSRVLTIMTCNDINIVPPELYRAGRIDDEVELVGLLSKEGVKFAESLVDTYDFDVEKVDPYETIEMATRRLYQEGSERGLDGKLTPTYSESKRVAHGEIEAAVVRSMKTLLSQAPPPVTTVTVQLPQAEEPVVLTGALLNATQDSDNPPGEVAPALEPSSAEGEAS